jgi:aryl-alcohol dehydrogenase-like predicted oxidoreductase
VYSAGASEEIAGKATKDRREDVWLGTDHIDFYQVHRAGPTPTSPRPSVPSPISCTRAGCWRLRADQRRR